MAFLAGCRCLAAPGVAPSSAIWQQQVALARPGDDLWPPACAQGQLAPDPADHDVYGSLLRRRIGLGVMALCSITLSIAAGLPQLAVAPSLVGEALVGLALASLLGAVLGLLVARVMVPQLMASFALGGAVRNVSLLWSATLGLAPPEGELVLMLGTLWTLFLPALLGLLNWRPRGSIAPSGAVGRRQGMITPQFRADYRTSMAGGRHGRGA